jgi:hypothetical protein
MKTFATSICIIVFYLALASCQKELSSSASSSGSPGSSAGSDIKGNYDFVSLHAKTKSTNQSVSGSDVLKTVTVSDYTTANNTGTITIDASNITSTNIGYSANAVGNASYFENGALIDTFSIPLQFTIPPSSGVTAYKQISSDSLYFQSGFIVVSGTSQTSQPGGAKMKFENGILTLTSNISQTSTQVVQGESITIISEGTSVSSFRKK